MYKATKMSLMLVGILYSLSLWVYAQADSEGAQQFTFKFPTGRSLSYAMSMQTEVSMDVDASGQKMSMNMTVGFRWQLKLTAAVTSTISGINQDGVTRVKLEPTAIEGDWNLQGPGGVVLLKLRGPHLTGTQNGNQIIDTANNIGVEQAEQFKSEIAPLYMSGEMDITPQGRISHNYGTDTFVQFWNKSLESDNNFFGVVFPNEALPVHGTWNETQHIRELGQVKLDGDGLKCLVTYTRKPDLLVQNQKVQVFTLSAPLKAQNLGGYMQQGGQQLRVNITNMERNTKGLVRYHARHGMLLDSDVRADAHIGMYAQSGGQDATMTMRMNMNMKMRYVPEKKK